MFSYALRNAAHYRVKYAAAFGLICIIAFLLSLSLFLLRGVQRESAKFARAFGDFQISAQDMESSRRLEPEMRAYFGGKAERWVGITSSPGGTGFNAKGQYSIRAYQIEEMRALGEIGLTEGELPAEGELLLPSALRKKIASGETITFVFKTHDMVLDSRKLRVSGFYSPFSQFGGEGAALVTRSQFLEMNPDLDVPNAYFVYLSGYGGPDRRIMGQAEYDALEKDVKASFAASGIEVSLWENSIYRHNSSKQYIDLLIVIAMIFVAVLIVMAAMTIVNVLFLAILDRVRILAAFMAFGMTKTRAVLLLSCELLVFAFLASGLGIVLSAALSPLLPLWRIDMENWVIRAILGDAKRFTSIPNVPDALATMAVGTAFPFVTAVFAIRRLLKGQLAQLLSFKK